MKQVNEVVQGVLSAISSKDPAKFGSFFATRTKSLSFGHPWSGEGLQSRDAIVKAAERTFEYIHTIEAIPDERGVQIDLSGKLATFSVVGVNKVVDKARTRREAPWRWTGTMTKIDGSWQITSDHLSFLETKKQFSAEGFSADALEAAAACCAANLQVNVSMPQLNLKMRTAQPVLMFSSVETIPPVGYTASVSLLPTPLVGEDGRQVGTLTSARVAFRETVNHVPVDWEEPGVIAWSEVEGRFNVTQPD
jgi:hypothetical protein